MSAFTAHFLYGLAWLSFGVLHSLLAEETVKHRLRPVLGSGYRLVYNVFALLHFAAVLAVGGILLGPLTPFALSATLDALLIVSFLAGTVLMIVAARGYDLARLAGTRQIRCDRAGIDVPEDEPLRKDGLHRFIRHPIYAGGLLFLWGGASSHLGMATAVWGSAYLLIGIVLEERRLVRLYGDAYRHYRSRVPALIPWRGRAI